MQTHRVHEHILHKRGILRSYRFAVYSLSVCVRFHSIHLFYLLFELIWMVSFIILYFRSIFGFLKWHLHARNSTFFPSFHHTVCWSFWTSLKSVRFMSSLSISMRFDVTSMWGYWLMGNGTYNMGYCASWSTYQCVGAFIYSITFDSSILLCCFLVFVFARFPQDAHIDCEKREGKKQKKTTTTNALKSSKTVVALHCFVPTERWEERKTNMFEAKSWWDEWKPCQKIVE